MSLAALTLARNLIHHAQVPGADAVTEAVQAGQLADRDRARGVGFDEFRQQQILFAARV